MRSKPLHIVHTIYRFGTGGLENGVVNLINNLPESSYRHTILTLDGVDPDFAKRLQTDNVDFFDVAKKPGKDFMVYFRVYKLLKQLKPDILHTRNLATLECQFPGLFCSIPYRVHGEHGWDIFDVGGTNKKYQWVRKPFKFIIDQYIALSSESADYLKEKIGVNASKIKHICNGVDMQRFQTKQDIHGASPEHFFSPDNVVFGTVGRLAEVKNQGYLVDAFIALAENVPDRKDALRLLVVGDGVLMPELVKRIEQAGLSNQVWFAGNRSDVAAMLQKMDVFVLPSLAEGISNTFLEAMATGLPIIATAVGGNLDLICPAHRESNLVPVNNTERLTTAMAQYVTSPDKIATDGAQTFEHCKSNFSLDIMVEAYHQIYQNKFYGDA